MAQSKSGGENNSNPITIVVAPGQAIVAGCYPPTYDCPSKLGYPDVAWREATVYVKKTDLQDSKFEKPEELKFVEDWILRLIRTDLGKYLMHGKKPVPIAVTITPATAIAINKALVERAKDMKKNPSSCSSPKGDCGTK